VITKENLPVIIICSIIGFLFLFSVLMILNYISGHMDTTTITLSAVTALILDLIAVCIATYQTWGIKR